MMTLSDNTATNMTIDTVGLAPTNEMLARMGMANTYFYKKVFKPAEGPMPNDQKKFGTRKNHRRRNGRDDGIDLPLPDGLSRFVYADDDHHAQPAGSRHAARATCRATTKRKAFMPQRTKSARSMRSATMWRWCRPSAGPW